MQDSSRITRGIARPLGATGSRQATRRPPARPRGPRATDRADANEECGLERVVDVVRVGKERRGRPTDRQPRSVRRRASPAPNTQQQFFIIQRREGARPSGPSIARPRPSAARSSRHLDFRLHPVSTCSASGRESYTNFSWYPICCPPRLPVECNLHGPTSRPDLHPAGSCHDSRPWVHAALGLKGKRGSGLERGRERRRIRGIPDELPLTSPACARLYYYEFR